MLCIGHRGARGHAPENTLASVRKAIELGADWIEIDVYWVDGELVVFHDDRLERTTNGNGRLMDQSFADLRGLDAGNGEQIPTLSEVFELAANQVGINIELKGPGTAEPVVQFLQHRNKPQRRNPASEDLPPSSPFSRGTEGEQLPAAQDPVLLSSFRHDELRIVQQLAPEIRLGALFVRLPSDAIAQARAINAWSINPAKEAVTAELVATAHAAGLKVLVFTVNEVAEMERLRELGVDGIFTDYPDRLAQLNS